MTCVNVDWFESVPAEYQHKGDGITVDLCDGGIIEELEFTELEVVESLYQMCQSYLVWKGNLPVDTPPYHEQAGYFPRR